MTAGTDRGPAQRPRRAVVLFLTIDLLFLAPIGLLLAAYGLVGDVSYWDSFDRALAVGLGLAISALFVLLGAGIVRCNVLGLPSVDLASDGMRIGREPLSWVEVGEAVSQSFLGVPFLVIDTSDSVIARLRFIDRTLMRSGPPRPGQLPRLWITEQQLGMTVQGALRRVRTPG